MLKGFRGLVIVFFAVGAIVYMLSGSSTSNTSSSTIATQASNPATKTFVEGEPILVGYTGYGIWRSWWSSRLTGDTFLNQPSNAKYLFVMLSVVNKDNQARTIPPFHLVDDQGAEYDADARGYMVPGSIGLLESLNPSVSKSGSIVFNVPPDKNYRLKLSGGYWSGDSTFVKLEPAPSLPKKPFAKLERLIAESDTSKATYHKHD